MRTTKKMRITAAVAAILVGSAVTVYAAYDSTADPIVSLSYLSEIFKPAVKSELKSELSSSIKTEIAAAKNELSSDLSDMKDELSDELYSKLSDDYAATLSAMQKQIDALSNEYSEVALTKNRRLIADAACEVVLLSGSATVRSADPESGIIDCTDGVILYDGEAVPQNHKLLVPKNGDGRGVFAVSDTTLLVRGGYTLG